MAVALDQNLFVLSQYGPVAPSTLAGPVRQGLGKYGDGLFVEEGTTNLVLNPNANVDLSNFGTVGGSFTATRDTSRALFGAASVKVVMNASAADAFSLVVASMTGGQTYYGSVYIYFPSNGGPTAASNLYVDVQGAGAYDGPNYAANPNIKDQWQRIGGTAAPTTTGTGSIRIVTSGGANVGTFWVAAFQVEPKGYATSYADGSLGNGYAWTGTANASSSTRTASVLNHAVANVRNTGLTVAAVVRAGYSTGAAQAICRVGTTNSDSFYLFMQGGGVFAQKIVGGTAVQVSPGSCAAGDLLFVAVTYDGATFTAYESRNGGAVTATSSSSATVSAAAPTLISIGADLAGGGQGDSLVEQVLAFAGALTPAEVAALAAASSETNYASDPRIVLAAATGTVRDTVNAETPAGTGSYRADRTMKCYAETITPNAASPDDDGATMKITVPGGSGIGAGSTIAVGYPLQSYSYVVKRAASPGGVYDELYV